MDQGVIPVQLQASEISSFKVHHFSWYNIICGHLRSMFSATFKLKRPHQSSLESISNPSIVTVEDSVEEVEELSPSEQFSWNKMANIFSEYQTIYVRQGDELSIDTLRIARTCFDNLIIDEDKYAEGIYDSIIKVDRTYAERFFYYSQLPKIRPREHMTRHLKKIIEYHRLVLNAFEDDRTKAVQILNLLALSHVLMNVTISDFRLFDLAIGKFFYRMQMVDDSNVHHVVGYMATITMHMERLLQRHNLENRKRELLLMDNPEYLIDINSVCRENYRELKKWYQIQLTLRRAVTEREEDQQREGISTIKGPVFADSRGSTVTKPPSVNSDDIESWLIEFLKRGYKYKERDMREL